MTSSTSMRIIRLREKVSRGGREAITHDVRVRENENKKQHTYHCQNKKLLSSLGNDHHAGEGVVGDYSALLAISFLFRKMFTYK